MERSTWDGLKRLTLGRYQLSENEFIGPLRNRSGRRALVVLWLLGLLLFGAGLAASGLTLSWLWITPTLLIGGPASWLLAFATRNISNAPDDDADERDQAVRDRAHRRAYGIFLVPLVLVMALPVVYIQESIRTGTPPTLSVGVASYIAASFCALYLLYFMLPTLVVAWNEPDPPLDVSAW
jgi:hypothetical protein